MDRTLRVDHAKDYEPPEVRKMRQQERDRQKGKEVQDDGEERLNAKELLMKQLRGEAPAPKRGVFGADRVCVLQKFRPARLALRLSSTPLAAAFIFFFLPPCFPSFSWLGAPP